MKNKDIWKIIFVAYISLLLIFVVVKFNGSTVSLTDRINSVKYNRSEGFWNYNLIPFRSISPYLKSITDSYAYTNILGNIVPFVPLGFLIPIMSQKCRKLLITISVCFMSIIGIECFQFITMLGVFDVDDILLNILGCLVGFV